MEQQTRLLVLNRDQELAGIVSLGDISQHTDAHIKPRRRIPLPLF
jgi:hypothetical protein